VLLRSLSTRERFDAGVLIARNALIAFIMRFITLRIVQKYPCTFAAIRSEAVHSRIPSLLLYCENARGSRPE